MVYVESPQIVAVIPLPLPPNVNFDNTRAMIELLNLKGVFSGATMDYENLYLTNFSGIYKFYTISRIDQENLSLRLIPFKNQGKIIKDQ